MVAAILGQLRQRSAEGEIPDRQNLPQRIERNNLTLRTRIKRLVSKQSASRVPLKSTKKSSVPSLKAHVLLIGSTTQRSTYHHKLKITKWEVRVFTWIVSKCKVACFTTKSGGI